MGERSEEARRNDKKGVLLKAVGDTDKKISSVILSGGSGKMERVSDFKDVLPPFNRRREEKRMSSEETLRQQRAPPTPPPPGWMDGCRRRERDMVQLCLSGLLWEK